MDDRVRCPKCRHDQFQTRPGAKLDDQVTCKQCGAQFKPKDVLLEAAAKEVENTIEKTLRGSKSLTFKKTRR